MLGRKFQVLTASSDEDLEAAFAVMVQRRIGGLIVGVDPIFVDRSEKLPRLGSAQCDPGYLRSVVVGCRLVDELRNRYGRCLSSVRPLCRGGSLKGEKPADLPVIQSTKFDFVINLKTAKALGLTIPPGVLAIADEVIE